MTSTSTTRATATIRVTSKAPADLMVVPRTTVDLAVPAALALEDLRVDSKDSSSTTRVALEALAALDNTRVGMADMVVPVAPVALTEDTVVGKLEMDVLEIVEKNVLNLIVSYHATVLFRNESCVPSRWSNILAFIGFRKLTFSPSCYTCRRVSM